MSLVYTAHKWPSMMSLHLWPYVMCMANEIMIATPTIGGNKSPMELFCGATIAQKIKHFHTCTIYVLDNSLQGQLTILKWKQQSCLVIYLGPSPNHSHSVHLVLNPRTGHVSPQFHMKHADFFEMVSTTDTTFDLPSADWKMLSGLVSNENENNNRNIAQPSGNMTLNTSDATT